MTMLAQRHAVTYTHIANGGKRPMFTAVTLKAMGMRAGVHDYLIRVKGLPPCWLEMKYGYGKLSEKQEEWQKELEPMGDIFIAAWSAEEALSLLRDKSYFPADSFTIIRNLFQINMKYPLLKKA